MCINNHVMKIGRIVRDATAKQLANGKGVINFSIAVDRPYSEETDYFKQVLWHTDVPNGKSVFDRAKYFTKGRLIAVAGYDVNNKFTIDNTEYRETETIVQGYQFLEKRPEGVNDQGGSNNQNNGQGHGHSQTPPVGGGDYSAMPAGMAPVGAYPAGMAPVGAYPAGMAPAGAYPPGMAPAGGYPASAAPGGYYMPHYPAGGGGHPY